MAPKLPTAPPAEVERKRYPRAEACAVARELCEVLKPVCEQLIVAGSLRRRKESVKDVEIVFVPRFEDRPDGLFDTVRVNLADEAIEKLEKQGKLTRRPSVTGGFAWGPKNKLALHHSGMPVDLFTSTAESWWNYLVCRTGPEESNTRIAMRAKERGYKWNPYGSGFTRLSDNVNIPMDSEQKVFAFVGLSYLEPWDRR